MNFRLLLMILPLIVLSSTQCNVAQKLKAASNKIASMKQDIKAGKIMNACSRCGGGGGGGNGCSRCNKI